MFCTRPASDFVILLLLSLLEHCFVANGGMSPAGLLTFAFVLQEFLCDVHQEARQKHHSFFLDQHRTAGHDSTGATS